jgi:phage shock protein PspC (stress-responsive transcriptional regulator)
MPETRQIKKLYRSEKERILGGVCGGIAEYLGVDPSVVRLTWVFFTLIILGIGFTFGLGLLLGGVGITIYLVAWAIVPDNTTQKKVIIKQWAKSDSKALRDFFKD